MQKYLHTIKALTFAALLSFGFASCAEESEQTTLTLSQYELSIDENEYSTTFDIETLADWLIESPSWITCNPKQGSGYETISITIDANSSTERSGEIVVTAGNLEKKITVSQEESSYKVHEHGSVYVVKAETADAPRPAQVIIVGDGYSSADCEVGGLFEQNVQDASDALFSIEPFKEYNDYFRVTAVVAYSQESGATVQSEMICEGLDNIPAQTKNTYFSTTFEGGTSTGVTCNSDRAYTLIKEKMPDLTDEIFNNSTVIMLVNINAYAGVTIMDYTGSSLAICPAGDYLARIVNHEAGGHGWGRLADEYENYTGSVPSSDITIVEMWRELDPYYYNNIGFSSSLDQVHWGKYRDISGYDAVSIYEGGLYYEKGAWKAEEVTCMLDNSPYYSAPSREAIVQRIFKASGLTFDFDDFVERDHIKSLEQALEQSSVMLRTATYGIDKELPRLSAPIMVN